jgi:predicted DCC family thiol-disulfide oxidoreductase YuxK
VTGTELSRYTVVYDGHCGICTRLAVRLAEVDRHGVFEIVPSQRDDVRARFPWIPPRAYAEALQVIRDSDGTTWQGAAAVEQIVSELRAGWLLSWIFAIPFARAAAERFYRWFATHRNQFGCGDHCQLVASGEREAPEQGLELGRQESNLQLPE